MHSELGGERRRTGRVVAARDHRAGHAADEQKQDRCGEGEGERAACATPPRLTIALAQQLTQPLAQRAEVVLRRGEPFSVTELSPHLLCLGESPLRAGLVPDGEVKRAELVLSPSDGRRVAKLLGRPQRDRERADELGPASHQRQEAGHGASEAQRFLPAALADEALQHLEHQVDPLWVWREDGTIRDRREELAGLFDPGGYLRGGVDHTSSSRARTARRRLGLQRSREWLSDIPGRTFANQRAGRRANHQLETTDRDDASGFGGSHDTQDLTLAASSQMRRCVRAPDETMQTGAVPADAKPAHIARPTRVCERMVARSCAQSPHANALLLSPAGVNNRVKIRKPSPSNGAKRSGMPEPCLCVGLDRRPP